MPSECGLTPAMLAGIGDARIRQRMEACQQGIVQLDSLRQKHTRLMEQLRSQYPDFATPPSRSTSISATATENLHAQYSKTLPPITESPPTPHRYESTTLPQPSSSSSSYAGAGSAGVAPVSASSPPPSTSLPTAMNAAFATRCESPISACMSSHRSSVSIDSGYTSISSDPFLSMISATPMSYSAFRKKASTLERPPTAHTSSTTATSTATATDLSPSDSSPSKSSSSVTLQQQCQKREETNTANAKNEEEEIESTSEKMIERTIESTTGTAPMRQNRFGRKREDSSWQRPRSMFAMISSSSSSNNNNNNNDEENEDKNGDSKNYNLKDKEKESFANVSVATTARKLLDTSTFSQITPPPMSRKFATLQKTTPPKPLPRSIYSSSQQPPLPPPTSSSSTPSTTIRSLSASSSALHEPHHQPQAQQHSSTISTTRTGFASRPPPQFAKFDSPIQLQNAKVFAPIQNSPKLAQSSPSAFTAAAKNNNSLKPGSTPPTKPRGNISCPIPQPLHQPHPHHQQQQQSRGAYLVPILASAKEILPPRHHRVGIANAINEMPPSLHSAQPASAVLSRQQSSDTNSTNSPLEIRKMFISTPHTITRYGGATTNNSSSSTTPVANGQNVNRYTFEKSSSSSSSSSQQQHQNYHHSQFPTSLHSSSTPRNRREKCWHESEGL